ncbi:MAG TPA: hypothetical protein VHR66_23570 [Gemmataceae bacterium]|nr:hypothetical protein [Gemmataceae bacterium]
MDYTLILIGSGSLVCLMPLALYLLYLSHLNGRTPPTLVPGPWDFASVLFGLSGFLILLGPLLITLVDSSWRGHAYGGWADMKSVGRNEALIGSLMAIGYLVLVSSGIWYIVRVRRPVTAIYNVAAVHVENALVTLLDDLGYSWRRANGQVEIGINKIADAAAPPTRFFAHETATVRVDPFPATAHATLRWGGVADGVRRDVETGLPNALAAFAGPRSPVAGWMFTAAVSVLIVMLLWLVVLIYIVMTPTTN